MKQLHIVLLIILLPIFSLAQQAFSLEQAIEYAIEHSDDMKLNQFAIERADAQVKEYKAIGMPTVSLGVNYQYYILAPAQPIQDFITPAIYGVLEAEGLTGPFQGTTGTQKVGFVQKNNLNANIEASALLFDGSYLVGLRAARLYKELESKSVAITTQEIRANVTRAYLNILITEINQGTIDKNIKNLNRSLTETREIYKSGFAEQLDVDRLELSMENLTTEAEKLIQLSELGKNLLKFQMNYPLDQKIELTEDIETLINQLKVTTINLEEEIDIEQRAEIDQILTGQKLNDLNYERIEKGRLPSVRAFGSFGEALSRNDLFDGNEVGFIPSAFVGLGVSMPLYDGGQRSGQLQQIKLDQEKTEIELQQFKRAVKLQVYNSRIQYINAKSTLENRERALDIVQQIYNKTNIKFKEGVGSSIEVTQAESSLYQAQANYVNALYDLLNAKIELDIALGVL